TRCYCRGTSPGHVRSPASGTLPSRGNPAQQGVDPVQAPGDAVEVRERIAVSPLEISEDPPGPVGEEGVVAPGIEGGDGRILSGHEDDAAAAEPDLLQRSRGRMHGVLDEHADRGEHPTENVGIDASGGIGREVLQEDYASVKQE